MNANPANNPAPRPAQTPSQAYQERANDIARLIDVLQMELEKHAQGHAAQPKRWDIVGDLGKVRSDLIDTVGFLAGMERHEMEAFLAE